MQRAPPSGFMPNLMSYQSRCLYSNGILLHGVKSGGDYRLPVAALRFTGIIVLNSSRYARHTISSFTPRNQVLPNRNHCPDSRSWLCATVMDQPATRILLHRRVATAHPFHPLTVAEHYFSYATMWYQRALLHWYRHRIILCRGASSAAKNARTFGHHH